MKKIGLLTCIFALVACLALTANATKLQKSVAQAPLVVPKAIPGSVVIAPLYQKPQPIASPLQILAKLAWRLKVIEQKQTKGLARLVTVERGLKRLQNIRRDDGDGGCAVGTTKATICENDDYSIYCTYRYVLYGDQKVVNIPVRFDDDFDEVPVVAVGLSGINTEFGKNCTVEVTSVTKDNFNIRLTLGGVLPLDVQLSWIACYPKHDD